MTAGRRSAKDSSENNNVIHVFPDESQEERTTGIGAGGVSVQPQRTWACESAAEFAIPWTSLSVSC